MPATEQQVNDHVEQIKAALKEERKTLPDLLAKLGCDEERMRSDVRDDIRWLNYVSEQAKESVLRKYFEANRAAFDGSTARCRHLLIAAPEGSTEDQRKLARNRAQDLRARIVAGEAFERVAAEHSACPSRAQGGMLKEFPRKGMMSEPFAAAAFALKPNELSEPVETEFGCHLIQMVERKPGATAAPRFEDAQDAVKSMYADDLRRATVAELRRHGAVRITLPDPARAEPALRR